MNPPLTHPQAAIRLFSCAYNIPESDFNLEAVTGPVEKKQRRAKTPEEAAELAQKKAEGPN